MCYDLLADFVLRIGDHFCFALVNARGVCTDETPTNKIAVFVYAGDSAASASYVPSAMAKAGDCTDLCACCSARCRAHAASSSTPQNRVSFEPKASTLCDASCESKLEGLEMQSMDSGVQYKDIQVGKGPATPVGFNVSPWSGKL